MQERTAEVQKVQVLQAIFLPRKAFCRFTECGEMAGVVPRLVGLSLLSAMIAGTSAYVSRFYFDMPVTSFLPQHWPFRELIFDVFTVAVSAAAGLLQPFAVLAVMAFIFLIFFKEIGYKQLFIVELYLQTIALIGAFIAGIMAALFPFVRGYYLSLGAVTQLFTDSIFINAFFGGLSIFTIWKVYVQYWAYRGASSYSTASIVWKLVLLNVFFLLIIGGWTMAAGKWIGYLERLPLLLD
ncbi:MAG TPA: hypothetical protein VFK44_14975 [Bacillales bacterium]|nr:hypothetical protein [Bacillales bacterium]